MSWTQKEIYGAHFGGIKPFKAETLRSGLTIIVDSAGKNALGHSRVSNKGAWIPPQDPAILEYLVIKLNE